MSHYDITQGTVERDFGMYPDYHTSLHNVWDASYSGSHNIPNSSPHLPQPGASQLWYFSSAFSPETHTAKCNNSEKTLSNRHLLNSSWRKMFNHNICWNSPFLNSALTLLLNSSQDDKNYTYVLISKV